MLSALLQTIANLGMDITKVNETFNAILATIAAGDTSSLNGLGDIMTGIISVFTGVTTTDISSILQSLIQSVAEVLSNDTTSTLLSTLSGS